MIGFICVWRENDDDGRCKKIKVKRVYDRR